MTTRLYAAGLWCGEILLAVLSSKAMRWRIVARDDGRICPRRDPCRARFRNDGSSQEQYGGVVPPRSLVEAGRRQQQEVANGEGREGG